MLTKLHKQPNLSKILTTCIIALGLLTTACTSGNGPGNISNQDVGTVVGGVAGGILGHQVGRGAGKTVATIGGALIGAMAGGAIGNRMDKVDAMNLNSALESQRDNRSSTWVNPNSNAKYTVTPTATTNSDGRPCRNYTMQAIINGKSEFVNGRACRVNGKWVDQ